MIIYHRSHLLREPETAIDMVLICRWRFQRFLELLQHKFGDVIPNLRCEAKHREQKTRLAHLKEFHCFTIQATYFNIDTHF